MKRATLILAALALLLDPVSRVEADLILYGADRTTGDMFSIDVNTAATVIIGNVGAGGTAGTDALGLAFNSSTDVMYLNKAFELYTVNTLNGALHAVGGHQPDATGITFNGTFSTLYTSRNNDIYTMNPSTGATTLLGPSGLSNSGITSFATNSAGEVFFSQSVSFTNPLLGSIYTLNTTTGAATLLFNDVTNGLGLDSIAFDNGGNFYGVTALGDFLVKIDLNTGTSTLIGALPYTGVQSLAFGPSPTVAEPSTLTLLGIGIVGMAGYAWRRRKQTCDTSRNNGALPS